MEKTIEQINEEIAQSNEQIKQLSLQKRQAMDASLNETIYGMFEKMTKEEVLAKIGEMMAQSPMLKMEVRRLLFTPVQNTALQDEIIEG